MQISCAFPTTLDSPDHIRIAEDLGYERAWLYDTPQQSPDVWMMLALAADRTERIGLGPGCPRRRIRLGPAPVDEPPFGQPDPIGQRPIALGCPRLALERRRAHFLVAEQFVEALEVGLGRAELLFGVLAADVKARDPRCFLEH